MKHHDIVIFSKGGGTVMVDIRLIQNDEIEQAIQLSDSIFRGAQQTSMEKAFPKIFTTSQIQSYGAFVEGELVSFMGLVPAFIHIHHCSLPVFSLGSVCTHEEHRGKGYAGMVLNKVFEHVEQAGASLLYVSGDRSIYTKADCYTYEKTVKFTMNSAALDSAVIQCLPGGMKFREIEPTDWLQLTQIAARREVRFEQSIWDLADLIEAEAYASCLSLKHEVLVAEKAGKIKAFVVIAVPHHADQDQAPRVIEWAGDEREIYGLLQDAIRRYTLPHLSISVPWFEQKLSDLLEAFPAEQERTGCTLKIMNVERLIDQLRPYLRLQNSELNDRFSVKALLDGNTEVTINETKHMLDPEMLVTLLFGKDQPTALDTELVRNLADFFPIPLPRAKGLNYV
jgi:GNAT superfamily N-acetyltransferase